MEKYINWCDIYGYVLSKFWYGRCYWGVFWKIFCSVYRKLFSVNIFLESIIVLFCAYDIYIG